MKVVKFTHTHSLARAHAYSKTQNIYGVMKTSHLIFWENLSFFSLDLTSAVAVVVGVTHFLSLLRRALSPLEYNRNYILNMRYIPKWSKSCTHCTYIIFFWLCVCMLTLKYSNNNNQSLESTVIIHVKFFIFFCCC